jgi:predicted RNase H-like HicB family nuclease
MTYKVVLIHSEEGYSVSCPSLPGCASQGDTEEEALENIKDAIREYLEVVNETSKIAVESVEVNLREAVEEKLAAASKKQEKPWVRLAGGLKHLHKETARINEIMKREFEQIA